MQSNSTQKPEYVLKRANDLINSATSNEGMKEKSWALDQLHSFIGNRRKVSQWSKTYEVIMKRHLELCVDLKNHHYAKDGLHQYRNLCQTLDPNSLEVVILYLLELSEARASAARQRANKVALAAAAKISDLDQEESPESIMLSSMTEEGARERTNREVVVPWLKFLWETYRAVLELLIKFPKLEKVYHKTCEKAFKFCQDYQRRQEFRRLCEILRAHLSLGSSSSFKSSNPAQAAAARNIKPASWEWTPETTELHLQTRFYQLEVASSLELWNEAFHTVEDIYNIMGRRTPRPRLMSVYYEKLTRIFWVSENYLFHAYASFRYFNLVRDYRKDLKPDERRMLASSVLLAAVSVPTSKEVDDNAAPVASEEDDFVNDRHQQIASLLDFKANPSRKSLLADIVNKGILADVIPELSALYNDLEVKFHPLTLAKSLEAAVKVVKSIPTLAVYAEPLQRVITLRVLQQLSKVYNAVRLSFVHKLLGGLDDVSPATIEEVMIDGVSRKLLNLRIDQASSCVRFVGSSISEPSSADQVLTKMGTKLSQVERIIALQENPALLTQEAESRRAFFAKVTSAAPQVHAAILERKNLIEKRKVEIEHAHEERERINQLIAAQEVARRQQEDADRLEKDRLRREEEKRKASLDKEEVRRTARELEKLGAAREEAFIASLDSEGRKALITKAKQDAVLAKEDGNRKLVEAAKRLDHITRALRIESRKKVVDSHSKFSASSVEEHERASVAAIEAHRVAHERALEIKKRAEVMAPFRQRFEGPIVARQRQGYAAMVEAARLLAYQEHLQRKIATARRKADEEYERQQEEAELEREQQEKEKERRLEIERNEAARKRREEIEAQQRAEEEEKAQKLRDLELKRTQMLAASRAQQQKPEPASPAPVEGAAEPTKWRGGPSNTGSASPRPAAEPTSGAWRPSRSSEPAASSESGSSAWRPSRAMEPSSGSSRFGPPADGRRDSGGFGSKSGEWQGSRQGGFGDRPADDRRQGGFGDRPADDRRQGGFGDRRPDDRRQGGGFEDRRTPSKAEPEANNWRKK